MLSGMEEMITVDISEVTSEIAANTDRVGRANWTKYTLVNDEVMKG